MLRYVGLVDRDVRLARTAVASLLAAGIKTLFIPGLDDIPLVFQANGHPDALIVNFTDDMTGVDLASELAHVKYEGLTIVLSESATDPRSGHLRRLSRARCIVRPKSPELLADILLTLVGEAAIPRGDDATLPGYHGIVGRSSKMLALFSWIEKIAGTDANVCISGESGTGKELIARAIHYASPRHSRPLITLDCTTIPEGLMESHLLGHVKGAFTGAIEHRDGVFSLAHTGTLFIDELAELTPALQAKLLRVIQTREFVMVGGSKPIRTDVRLITATNKDLEDAVRAGTFREDLYYRVAVCMIRVPPVRQRPEDIPALVEHFLEKFSTRYGRRIVGIEHSAMKRVIEHPWPGNVRQLENFLEQAVVMAEGDLLAERDLFTSDASPWAPRGPSPSTPGTEPGPALREVERRHILGTLDLVRGNRTEAARLLRISLRSLQYKLREFEQEDLAKHRRR